MDAAFTLTVSDEGPGIAPEDFARLFRPFERGAHEGVARAGSFGLGLSIARMIVDAHGGSIDAAPRPEGGTVFVVRLPGEEERRDDDRRSEGAPRRRRSPSRRPCIAERATDLQYARQPSVPEKYGTPRARAQRPRHDVPPALPPAPP